MSKSEKRGRLNQVNMLAVERATLWRVYRAGVTGWKLVKCQNEETALRRVRKSTCARPVLPSSEWRAIYQEVGL